jgi:hypothetical protein
MTQLWLEDHEWVDRQVPVIMQAMVGKEFTADDARAVVTEQPMSKGLMGFLFARLRCSGSIYEVRRERSKRAGSHARKVSVWKLV